MRVVSSNIRFDNPADGAWAWPNRKELLADVLLKLEPDVIATQEGWGRQVRELVSLLPGFRIVDEHRDWIEARMYPCILVKEDHVDVRDSGDSWLSATPQVPESISFGSYFPRLLTWAVLRDRRTEKSLVFANMHLDNGPKQARIEQAKVAGRELNAARPENVPVIIAGDFNAPPDGEVRQVFMEHLPQLEDPWTKLGKAEEGSFHGFGQHLDDNIARIDWILLDKRLRCHDIRLDKSCRGALTPSDHYPVVCDFDCP